METIFGKNLFLSLYLDVFDVFELDFLVCLHEEGGVYDLYCSYPPEMFWCHFIKWNVIKLNICFDDFISKKIVWCQYNNVIS